MIILIYRKPERAIYAKVKDQKTNMTAEAYQWKDTLCRFTGGDFFHTFYQQWALPLRGISCYPVPDLTLSMD
ncbi:hypothetical protein MTR_3g067515 [Medicago truncatula]|uniref:Uncharacterized protein n=1 Tax=Medicago truncatula TaxID=3880 RepID=A0A072V8Z1_MEDTR|nr:hypothetical protein MTR_3g067515 [Medicago truncatula]